jgi:sec-independent protein translocase protein TatA
MTIGFWQVLLVLLIVLILFGAGKLPRVMGDLAKGIKSFKSGMKDDEEEPRTESERLTAERVDATTPSDRLKNDDTARG